MNRSDGQQMGARRRGGAKIANLPDREILIGLFEKMVLLRRFEQAAQIACRKGETPGFLHLYIGQEAVATGVCANLSATDWVTSTHRGHGHALAKGADPNRVMAELFGKADGICGGRGGTMHLYDRTVGLFGTNGIVAAGIGHAVGIGISARQRGTSGIGVAFFGDGATNHGAFHEALNFAAVQKAPTVFICENNLYATATPLSSATLNTDIADKVRAYGINAMAVDGNDVFAVYQAMKEATERARSGLGPSFLECRTYRTVGHHEGDPVVGTYRSQDEIDVWLKRDPIEMFKQKLTEEFHVAEQTEMLQLESAIDDIVAEALEFARKSPAPEASTVSRHVFAHPINPPAAIRAVPSSDSKMQGWLAAVRDGIAEEMRQDPNILYFGEGTGERGGSFAQTKNLWDEFGAARMVDTPISEQGFTAAAIGASATGARTVCDLMFADFVFETAGQIFLQAAKLRYMSNGNMSAPVVVRVAGGALRSAGPHHSGMYHPVFAHMPGLVVCVPSTPADAKGLMKTALRASDPVIFIEPKALFASKGNVPLDDCYVPFGIARTLRSGTDISVVSVGTAVHNVSQAADILNERGISVEVIDLRTIVPLDIEAVVKSLRKTHRLLIVDEAWAMCGLGAEIAQSINELAFDELDAPVGRLHTLATSHPFAPVLEQAMLINSDRVVAAIESVIAGTPPIPSHWHSIATDVSLSPTAPTGPVAGVDVNAVVVAAETTHAPKRVANQNPLDGVPITMPFGDLTVSEGKIIKWHKAAGDHVEEGDLVAEIETDKAVVEIEAPTTGKMAEIEQPEGAVVPMGARIGAITS